MPAWADDCGRWPAGAADAQEEKSQAADLGRSAGPGVAQPCSKHSTASAATVRTVARSTGSRHAWSRFSERIRTCRATWRRRVSLTVALPVSVSRRTSDAATIGSVHPKRRILAAGEVQVGVERGQRGRNEQPAVVVVHQAVAGLAAGEVDQDDREPVGGLHRRVRVVDGWRERLAGDVDELADAEPDVLLDVTVGQRVPHIPAHRQRDHLGWEAKPGELGARSGDPTC